MRSAILHTCGFIIRGYRREDKGLFMTEANFKTVYLSSEKCMSKKRIIGKDMIQVACISNYDLEIVRKFVRKWKAKDSE